LIKQVLSIPCQDVSTDCCRRCYNADGSENGQCTSNDYCHSEISKQCCQEYHSNPPMKVEDALKSGKARFVFGNRLFQKGCTDENCEFRVEHCTPEKLNKADLRPNRTALDKAAEVLVQRIQKLDVGVESFENLTQGFMEVSATRISSGYGDAELLFQQVVKTTMETEMLEGISNYCPYEHWNHTSQSVNKDWTNDPCCNWDLRRTKCCMPRTITGAPVVKIGEINMDVVKSKCAHPEKIKLVLKDLSNNIKSAQKCAADLNKEVSASALDKLREFEETCTKKIGLRGADQMDRNGACTTDDDCFCSYTTCNTQRGECSPAYDFMGECFAQCFEVDAPPKLVRIVKQSWNISSTDPQSKFEKLFVEKMTDQTCIGHKYWENRDTIGENRLEWRCNSTCQGSNMCHRHHILEAFYSKCENDCRAKGIPNCWKMCNPWDKKQVCEGESMKTFGTQYSSSFSATFIVQGKNEDGEEYGHCEVRGIQTSCGCDHCFEPCHNNNTCVQNGGDYFTHTDNDNHGQCCGVQYDANKKQFITKAKSAFVHQNSFHFDGKTTQFRECKYSKPGTPDGWEVRNEECCRGQGGEWNGGHSQCCFGKLTTECDWRGKCETHCREHFDSWSACDKCRDTECDQQKCSDCEDRRSGCCGIAMMYANKTACLMYKEECNDMKLRRDDNGAYWQHSSFSFTNEHRSEVRGNQLCGAFTAPTGTNTQETILYDDTPQCFRNRWDGIESITEPARCIVTSVVSKVACEGLSTSHKWVRREVSSSTFDCLDLNDTIVDAASCYRSNAFTDSEISAACTDVTTMSDTNKDKIVAKSTATNRASVPTPAFYYPTVTCTKTGKTVQFTPSKYSTKAECDLATCTGTLDWTYDQDLKFVVWNTSQCKALSKPVCSSNRHSVTTENACNSEGYCQGDRSWEFAEARGCQDAGWPCGASSGCEIPEQVTETYGTGNSEINVTYETRRWKQCNNERYYWDGVCVNDNADASVECPQWNQQHPKGCRVDAPWITVGSQSQQNETWCVENGYKFYNRSDYDTKTKCENIRGCMDKEMGWTPRNLNQCSACGTSSEWKQRFRWNGGVWGGGVSRPMKWDESGIGERSINSWVPTFSPMKMKKELQKPLLRMFSESKKSQMLLMFNYYVDGLKDLACDCGVEKRSDCFNESSSNASTLVSVGTSFCGDDENSVQGGCGKVEVKQSCSSRRRRRRLLQTDASGESSALSFGHVSAGKFSEPVCTETGNENSCTCSSASTSAKLETMSVKNAGGMTIGQVAGDGIDFAVSTGSVFPDSIEKCLDFRIDINHQRSEFNTTDVAKYDGSNFITLGYGDHGTCGGNCVSITKQQICFKATSAGIYFPILRTHLLSSADVTACSVANFDSTRGICTAGGKKGCRCGYYGSKCDLGCPNSCSETSAINSRCDAQTHTCKCPPTHVGNDCSLLNCPRDANDNFCSARGVCEIVDGDAKCKCSSQYVGTACENAILLDREVNGGMTGSGKNGIGGMAFQFGWDFPALLIAIIMWILILSPCCWLACCFYCPCCCRKQNCCCWAEKWGCGKNKSICACRCCHTYCEAHAIRLGSHAELMKHQYFAKADKNHDGLLDAHELKAMVKKRFDAVVTVGQISLLIAKFDGDNDGRLTEREYRNMLTSLEKQDTEHTKKQMKSILEGLPDAGNVRSNQVAPSQVTEMI
jgi:hypothetical protein